MESIQIYLHSKNADKLYNGVSDAEYILPPIEIPDGFHIYLSVQNVSIPYSFYNVNNTNNLLSYYQNINPSGSVFATSATNTSMSFYVSYNYNYYTYNVTNGNTIVFSSTRYTNNILVVSNLSPNTDYTLNITYDDNFYDNLDANTVNTSQPFIIRAVPTIPSKINLTLTNGNYNITQLVDYLKSIMTGFNISYNIITNKLTFTHSTYDFTFLSASTCLMTVGFNSSASSTSLTLTSPNCINIMSVKRINIGSNLITYNINKATRNDYSILCSIPVDKPAYSLIEYNNTNHFRTNLFINLISIIRIKLMDENGALIDLNGNNYCMTIQLDVEPFVV